MKSCFVINLVTNWHLPKIIINVYLPVVKELHRDVR